MRRAYQNGTDYLLCSANFSYSDVFVIYISMRLLGWLLKIITFEIFKVILLFLWEYYFYITIIIYIGYLSQWIAPWKSRHFGPCPRERHVDPDTLSLILQKQLIFPSKRCAMFWNGCKNKFRFFFNFFIWQNFHFSFWDFPDFR